MHPFTRCQPAEAEAVGRLIQKKICHISCFFPFQLPEGEKKPIINLKRGCVFSIPVCYVTCELAQFTRETWFKGRDLLFETSV